MNRPLFIFKIKKNMINKNYTYNKIKKNLLNINLLLLSDIYNRFFNLKIRFFFKFNLKYTY